MREGRHPVRPPQAPALREAERAPQAQDERCLPEESPHAVGLMSALLSRLQAELTTARKAQDKLSVLVLGTTIAEVKYREIEVRRDLTDDDVIDVIRRAIKKRREAVELYEKGGRPELAATERLEAQMLDKYLPAQVDPAELR